MLSDGEDTSSLVTFDQLLDSAKRSPTVIYAIGLGLVPSPTKRSDGEFALRQLSRQTGGQLFMPKQSAELSNVYTQIARELTASMCSDICLVTPGLMEGGGGCGCRCENRTCKREHEQDISHPTWGQRKTKPIHRPTPSTDRPVREALKRYRNRFEHMCIDQMKDRE